MPKSEAKLTVFMFKQAHPITGRLSENHVGLAKGFDHIGSPIGFIRMFKGHHVFSPCALADLSYRNLQLILNWVKEANAKEATEES